MTRTAIKSEPALDERHPDFTVITRPLEVRAQDDGADESPRLVATASSTAVDLEADRFTKSALEQMRDGFKGRLIFMNHSYKVPADVFGTVEETSLVKRDGRLDLDMTIRIETGNPAAVQTYDYVANGTRLGVSVGVIVTDAEKTEEEDDYGKRIVDISGVIPLEASIVGIPANQTAWTQQAVKSLFERGAIELDDEEVAARPWLIKPGVAEKATSAPAEMEGRTMTTTLDTTITLDEEIGLFIKGAVPGHSPAKAPRDRPWTASEAVKRLRTWAGGPAKEDISWAKYKWGFAWFNGENPENFGSYKLAHHDIVNGTFMVVFRGAAAAAVVLQGGRGGVAIPEGDVDRVKSHVARHYHQFDEKAPWEREKTANWLPEEVEVAVDLEIELPGFEEAFWPNTWGLDADSEEEQGGGSGNDHNQVPGFLTEEIEQEDLSRAAHEHERQGDVMRDLASLELEDLGESENEEKQEPETETDGGKQDDFEDEVAADLAVDELLDKMFSGFRACMNGLIDILMNTDLGEEERRKQGMSLIEDYQDFVANTWDETIDGLGEKAVGPFVLDVHLHDALAEGNEALCETGNLEKVQVEVEQIAEKVQAEVEQIAEQAQGFADENATLREENARKAQALEYATQVVDAVMELRLPTVTAEAARVARRLADQFPGLDNRVVERLVRYAPRTPDSEKE